MIPLANLASKSSKRIAIFASGTGSNAMKIIEHFEKNENIHVSLIVSNKKEAGVLNFAKVKNIASIVIDKDEFYKSDKVVDYLLGEKIDMIALAGFLWLIPINLIRAFPRKIINIHPALLPKYGGKGMYGMHVHKAVKENGDSESGITIHYVNQHYDEGQIIFQKKVAIDQEDSAEDIRNKVLVMEHYNFPRVLESLLL